MQKSIVSTIILRQGKAVTSLSDPAPFAGGDPVLLAEDSSNRGADALLLMDQSRGDEEHDLSLTQMRQMARLSDIPMWGAGNISRPEDVKKILYAGCRKAVLNAAKPSNLDMLEEVSKRFGRDKIAVCIAPESDAPLTEQEEKNIRKYAGAVILLKKEEGALSGEWAARFCPDGFGSTSTELLPVTVICLGGQPSANDAADCLRGAGAEGFGCGAYADPSEDLMKLKNELRSRGLEMNTYACAFSWDDLKKGPDGLVPVVVQDYRNEEVLMVAYMNREAYEATVRSGRMTYWSRSRSELWLKGETSGHFQYLKELRIDCDNDTLLARIAQVGAACHTGNRSCFYRTALKKDTPQRNPMKVFEDVYGTIEDRKAHPKEGSYTNYLFEKGIDKILKKCGEEATEIVIAAKNPNPEEIKYEMADFLYHMMVLMVHRDITWDDIAQELANRE